MEMVQARNALDALVHSVKKSLAEYGDKVGADEKAKIESALKDAEELLKQKDATQGSARRARPRSSRKAAQKLGEAMYAQAQAAQGGAGGGGGPGARCGRPADGGKQDEKVVDAEFTEVKDKK